MNINSNFRGLSERINFLDVKYFSAYLYILVAFFVVLRQGHPILALPWAGHDDALFFRAIDRIARGDWLGDFDNRTLAKGPFIGIFGAIGIGPRIWFKTLEALLYACAMLVFSLVALRMGVQKFLILFGVLLLSLNPHLWSGPGNRLIRDVLYSAQAVIFIGLVVYSLTRTHQRSELVKLGFATGHLEEPPQSGRFVIHWFGDLQEVANAGTGGVLGR